MRAAAIDPASDGPLTQERLQEFALANGRAKKTRRAAGVAGCNGWVTGVLAALSAPFALLGITGFLVTLGLSVVAYNEFRGRKRLLQFDPSAPALLGWNQLGLLALVVVYCVWMLFTNLTGAGALAATMKVTPEVAEALGSLQFEELYKGLVVAVYGTVILLSAIFQGLNAFYYFSRRKHIEVYLQETPKWVVDLQRMSPHV